MELGGGILSDLVGELSTQSEAFHAGRCSTSLLTPCKPFHALTSW